MVGQSGLEFMTATTGGYLGTSGMTVKRRTSNSSFLFEKTVIRRVDNMYQGLNHVLVVQYQGRYSQLPTLPNLS